MRKKADKKRDKFEKNEQNMTKRKRQNWIKWKRITTLAEREKREKRKFTYHCAFTMFLCLSVSSLMFTTMLREQISIDLLSSSHERMSRCITKRTFRFSPRSSPALFFFTSLCLKCFSALYLFCMYHSASTIFVIILSCDIYIYIYCAQVIFMLMMALII